AYFALTGVRPFAGDAIAPLVLAIMSASFVPPCSVNPSLPPAIDVWMAKALARDPEDRFGSAKEMAEAFAAAARGESVAAPGGAGVGLRWPWAFSDRPSMDPDSMAAPPSNALARSTMVPSVLAIAPAASTDAPANEHKLSALVLAAGLFAVGVL